MHVHGIAATPMRQSASLGLNKAVQFLSPVTQIRLARFPI